MMADARQSVTKWNRHLSLPHKCISFIFIFPNQGNHMLKQQSLSCVPRNSPSSSPHCLLACRQWGCSQVRQDRRAVKPCWSWGCSCHLLHELEGRQGGQKGIRRAEAQLKAPWAAASQPFCHRHILKQRLHGQLLAAHITSPPTLAPPGVMVLSRSSWHQLFPAHIWSLLGVRVQASQTPKIINRMMPFGMLIILYSNAALQTSVGVRKRKKLNSHTKPKHHSRREQNKVIGLQ